MYSQRLYGLHAFQAKAGAGGSPNRRGWESSEEVLKDEHGQSIIIPVCSLNQSLRQGTLLLRETLANTLYIMSDATVLEQLLLCQHQKWPTLSPLGFPEIFWPRILSNPTSCSLPCYLLEGNTCPSETACSMSGEQKPILFAGLFIRLRKRVFSLHCTKFINIKTHPKNLNQLWSSLPYEHIHKRKGDPVCRVLPWNSNDLD